MSDFGWPRRGFLEGIGLKPPASMDGKPLSVELAEADIDPHTGGAVAVTTKVVEAKDKHGKDVMHIKTYYWYMLPSGQQLSQKLFDIEFESGESPALSADGSTVKIPTMIPRAVWVLGRNLYDKGDDSEVAQDESDNHTSDGVMRNLSRVMGALGEVNRQMRQGKMPQVAKILHEYAVADAVGEKLVITGQSLNGGFDFNAADASAASVSGPLTVPSVVARALMGFGVNTLDENQRLGADTSIQGFDPKTGTVFTTEALVSEGDNPKVSTSIARTSEFGTRPAPSIPRLTSVEWKSEGDGRCTLESLNLLDEEMTGESQLTRMRAMGVTNRILHDLRNISQFPRSKDHLMENDLYHMIYEFEPPPPLSQGGRLTMISVGGNNMEPIADGFGESIGGNSKVIYHEGLGKDGKINRVGVIIDLGLYLSPKDEAHISAAPDVVEHLKHCKDILITHRHLDHTDGLFAYIQYGYLKGKVVHATPEVIRSLRDKLRTFPSIHQDDLPTFSPLKGEGWLHIKDKEGKTRLSVDYARNATPHSARCTPFCVHGHYEGKWIGSYLNHGDARYGRHNAEGYEGRAVEADHLNKAFFSSSNRRLLDEVPGLDPKIAERGPTYCDMDITSILRQGWAPTEYEVEDNLSEVSHWFKDKGMLLAMISTNDNRFETALRVATRSHRDLTEFGTNLQKTATTANVLGVNDLLHEPEARNNIQAYLDKFFVQRLERKIAKHRKKLETASEVEKPEIEKKIERHEARLEAFEQLRQMPNQFSRYHARDAMEAELEQRFGQQVTLGSIDEDEVTFGSSDEDEVTLGSLRVGRTSKTSRQIMNREDYDWRRLALLTGTQGTNVEVDAALTALSEGRSLMDGNPSNSHTARPVDPKNNVVVISQTAIPGNDRKQGDLVRKLTSRGFAVVQAMHDGFHIHNIDKARRREIIKALEKLHKAFQVEADGSLIVTGMPIHAGGHGHQEDCNAWINLVKADVTAAQHTSDPQAGVRFSELCKASGCRTMDRVVPNFEGLSIKAGDTPETTEIRSIGRTPASLIRIHTERQTRKYHGGHMSAQRLVSQESEGGFRSDGLLATSRTGGMYQTAFATVDAEQAAKDRAARPSGRPEPIPENRMAPPQERPDRGPLLPGREHRGRILGRREQPSAAFVGG